MGCFYILEYIVIYRKDVNKSCLELEIIVFWNKNGIYFFLSENWVWISFIMIIWIFFLFGKLLKFCYMLINIYIDI